MLLAPENPASSTSSAVFNGAHRLRPSLSACPLKLDTSAHASSSSTFLRERVEHGAGALGLLLERLRQWAQDKFTSQQLCGGNQWSLSGAPSRHIGLSCAPRLFDCSGFVFECVWAGTKHILMGVKVKRYKNRCRAAQPGRHMWSSHSEELECHWVEFISPPRPNRPRFEVKPNTQRLNISLLNKYDCFKIHELFWEINKPSLRSAPWSRSWGRPWVKPHPSTKCDVNPLSVLLRIPVN